MKVSVLILTLDEEKNIGECIRSVRSISDDIVVLDSGSQDNTVELAKDLGARIFARPFDNWSSHQSWALSEIEFRNDWVFNIDADERATAELNQEIVDAISSVLQSVAAFRFRRKDYFMGRWIKRAQLYPTWLVRLYRPEKVRFERLVNPVTLVDGETGELFAHLDHYPFSKGVSHWLERHNSYSSFEAKEAKRERGGRMAFGDIFSADPVKRRRCVKLLFRKLPFRSALKFIYYYLWRRGFLDGKAGFHYATLQAFYEYMIVLKTKEGVDF